MSSTLEILRLSDNPLMSPPAVVSSLQTQYFEPFYSLVALILFYRDFIVGMRPWNDTRIQMVRNALLETR